MKSSRCSSRTRKSLGTFQNGKFSMLQVMVFRSNSREFLLLQRKNQAVFSFPNRFTARVGNTPPFSPSTPVLGFERRFPGWEPHLRKTGNNEKTPRSFFGSLVKNRRIPSVAERFCSTLRETGILPGVNACGTHWWELKGIMFQADGQRTFVVEEWDLATRSRMGPAYALD